VREYGNDGIAKHPIGTGPFGFKEMELGVKIVLERNDQYWGTPAKPNQIVYRPLEVPRLVSTP
jgi:peptide/nickel transport system substrate-binding protein